MTTHQIDPLEHLNPSLTGQTPPQGTIEATLQTPPSKRIKYPERDKVGFEQFTERTSWQGKKMLLHRCQAWKRSTITEDGERILNGQCGQLANRKVGNGNLCKSHGGHSKIGKRSAAGEAVRIASITTHGELTKVAVEKKQRRVKTERTLKKLAYALGESEYDVRGKNLKAYPKPSIMDAVDLIAKLEELAER